MLSIQTNKAVAIFIYNLHLFIKQVYRMVLNHLIYDSSLTTPIVGSGNFPTRPVALCDVLTELDNTVKSWLVFS